MGEESKYYNVFMNMLDFMNQEIGNSIQIKNRYEIKNNRMQIFLDSNQSNHYEVCFRDNFLEIALHFESSKSPNDFYLFRMKENREIIQRNIDPIVDFEPFENLDYRRVCIKFPPGIPNEGLIAEYSKILAKLIFYTYPILQESRYRDLVN